MRGQEGWTGGMPEINREELDESKGPQFANSRPPFFFACYVPLTYFSLTMPAMVFYEARRVSLPLYQVVAFYWSYAGVFHVMPCLRRCTCNPTNE